MAYYHENLQYHEDKIPKRKITPEEIDFLIALQKEMNTQDNCGTEEPRFWIIKGEEKIYHVEDDADGWEIVDSENIVASDPKELFEYIRNEVLPEINEDMNNVWGIRFEDGKIYIESKRECYNGVFEAIEWLNEYAYKDYKQVFYKTKEKIYHDTLFLTQKAAENHLRLNHYHYDESAHTYATYAWRSPEIEILWKILQEVDWREMK